MAMFFVHHLLGVRPSRNELVVRPRLMSRMERLNAGLGLRGKIVDIALDRAETEAAAAVNGKTITLVNGELRLPLPKSDLKIEMKV